jgi:hypothetical protein
VIACVAVTGRVQLVKSTVRMDRIRLTSAAAVDGSPGNIISCVAVESRHGIISQGAVNISDVMFYATVTSGSVSLISLSGLTVAIFSSPVALVIVNGNSMHFFASVVQSQVHAEIHFECPTGATMRFTSAFVGIVHIPASLSSSAIIVENCGVTIAGTSKGFGGVPALQGGGLSSTALEANIVSAVGSFSPKIMYPALPPLILPLFALLNPAANSNATTTVLDGVVIHVTNTTLRSNEPLSTDVANSVAIAILEISGWATRNGFTTVISNVSLAFQAQTEQQSATPWRTCTTASGNEVLASVVGFAGSTTLHSSTRIAATRVSGVLGPLIAAYSLVKSPAVLLLQPNASQAAA